MSSESIMNSVNIEPPGGIKVEADFCNVCKKFNHKEYVHCIVHNQQWDYGICNSITCKTIVTCVDTIPTCTRCNIIGHRITHYHCDICNSVAHITNHHFGNPNLGIDERGKYFIKCGNMTIRQF